MEDTKLPGDTTVIADPFIPTPTVDTNPRPPPEETVIVPDTSITTDSEAEKEYKNDTVSKSWFCVFPNPENNFLDGTPEEIVDTMIEIWIKDNPQRSCAVSYCISSDGLKHLHAVLEDTKAMRFSAIKKAFPGMHIEPTKGSKKDAEDYINKRGKFKESGEQIIYTNRHGEIKGASGQRNDLEIIEELIKNGFTPNQVFDLSIQYRKHARIVKDAYYRKRYLETPTLREVNVYYHTGPSGSGKSYTRIGLVDIYGEDSIYTISQFDSGYMDKYSGEPILFIDELRGNIRYSQLLVLLDRQKHDIHARYGNICGLWNEVHITSVFPPERLYKSMIEANTDIDTYEQLRRRINYIVLHYKTGDEFKKFQIPMSEYEDYYSLSKRVKLETGHDITEKRFMEPLGNQMWHLLEYPIIDTL
jgi:hypothetical protein